MNPSLQALHDDFVRRGSRSLVDALTMGATIEDLDIVDLGLRDCGFTAIDGVSANLEKGTRSHLRALVTNDQRQGGEYRPSHLTLEGCEAIVGSPPERGRGG